MLTDRKIGFIGSGNMAEAIISGIVSSNAALGKNIICSDVRTDKLKKLEDLYGVLTTTDNREVVEQSEIIIYAVKPQLLGRVLKETADLLDMSKLLISIAAGVPLAAIESCLNKELRLIRVMPNICAFVKEGASAVAAGRHVREGDVDRAMAIFDSVGKSIFIEENVLMDAFTGMSGSGPAYIALVIESMSDAGVKLGMSREDSLLLSIQTVLGSAKLLLESGEHPGQLKDRVASPGGTAIVGVHTLEQGGLRPTMINAVEAASKRATELGELMIKNFAENNNK